MQKITEIYKKYEIVPILQMHQFRVAGVAMQICKSLNVEVDMESVVTACLIHDMGNVVKFDLVHTKNIFGLSDEEIEDIKKNQDEFIGRYGNDEFEANTKIAQEITNSERILGLVDRNRFGNLCIDKEGSDLEAKIIHYADSRVAPRGITSYDERMKEAGERYRDKYENYEGSENEKNRLRLVACGKEIEKEIFSHSKIKPEDINDASVLLIIEELKNFEI